MFVLIKRNPTKAITGITGGGILLDGNGDEMTCSWCAEQQATTTFDYFDPDNCTTLDRSNQPFREAICESCNDSTPQPEGYFYCDGCEETHIENYSWELFSVNTDDGQYCLACNEGRIALNFEDYILSPEMLETGEWQEKVIRLGGHQRPISPLFEIVQEFDAVADYSDAPTSMETVVANLRTLMENGESQLAIAITNAYQFCVDMAVIKLAER